VQAVPIKDTKPKITAPSLDRVISFATSSNYTQEIKDMYLSKINGLKSQIKANSNTLLPWIDLGSYYKAIGDYAGALEAWTYVSKAAPTDYISRGNIGNLYAYYLKDNGMAEMYYKDAISKGPKQTYLYIQLAEVYRDTFNNLDKAKAIIDQGLKVMPGDPALTEFKNSLK
jgi:tetratricopeptide (TPR) repeat protein